MASKIPFATDLTDYEKMPVSPFGKVKPIGEGTAQRTIEIRLVTVVYFGLPSSVPLSVQPYVGSQHSEQPGKTWSLPLEFYHPAR